MGACGGVTAQPAGPRGHPQVCADVLQGLRGACPHTNMSQQDPGSTSDLFNSRNSQPRPIDWLTAHVGGLPPREAAQKPLQPSLTQGQRHPREGSRRPPRFRQVEKFSFSVLRHRDSSTEAINGAVLSSSSRPPPFVWEGSVINERWCGQAGARKHHLSSGGAGSRVLGCLSSRRPGCFIRGRR